MQEKAAWIAVDWGTSNLRLWAIDGTGAVIATRTGSEGMSRLSPEGFEPMLLDKAADLLADDSRTEVIVCGMAGARGGWREAPYRPVPCRPAGQEAVTVPTTDTRLAVQILPGLSQAAPPDVMRGEETQIAGFLAGFPDFDGTLCLPGTHTKWVRVSAGEVVGFRTFMTGEIFGLLSGQSVLRHSLTGDGLEPEAFLEAVSDALSKPENTAAALFSIRAGSLLTGLSPQAARARLSGLLIGMELAAARPWWLGTRLALIGADTLTGLYHDALAAQGLEAETHSGDRLVLAGLSAARTALKGPGR